MVTPDDIDRAYFYANTCTKQQEKARDFGNYTDEDWAFFKFSYEYCCEVLGRDYWRVVEDWKASKKQPA